MDRALALLDDFYARSLGCPPADLNSGGITVVEGDLSSIRYAKGAPLALYAVATPRGGVISVRPGLAAVVEQAVAGATTLGDAVCRAVEHAVTPLLAVDFWFEGVRLVCEPETFLDRTTANVRELQAEDDASVSALREKWGGKVFGQVVDGCVVSRAAVKPLSDIVWDLSVDTAPGYRGRGFAKSTVSAALRHIFANGRLAGWGCDRDNAASLRVAAAVGFREYGCDFGCVAG